MEYRIDKEKLLLELDGWNTFLKRKVHLIACGGTAMTLLGIKPSTKDIDFMVPNPPEHAYLIDTLKRLGYKLVTGYGYAWKSPFVFDLFCGNKIHTTELLESPLSEGGNVYYDELSQIYIGILNYYDLITSKIFRGTQIDFDDCIMLAKAKTAEIDLDLFEKRFLETASYDVSEKKYIKNMELFLKRLSEE